MGEVEKLAAGQITCPACKSKISADGKSLFEEGAELVRLRKDAGKVKKLAAAVDALEKQIAASPAPAVEPKLKPAVASVVPEKVVENEPAKRPWFKRTSFH